MEFNIIIKARNLLTLATAVGNNTAHAEITDIKFEDEDKRTGLDNMVVRMNVKTPQIAFWIGKKYQETIKPYTPEEDEELQARYEHENDL